MNYEMVEKLMRDPVKADESKLPHICSLDWESKLSSIFVEVVDTPLGLYGTRSTAALTVKAGGDVNFYEIYLESGKWKEHTENYQIVKPPVDAPGRRTDKLHNVKSIGKSAALVNTDLDVTGLCI